MAAILQLQFSDTFLFDSNFNKFIFQEPRESISSIGSDNSLMQNSQQAIISTNDDSVYQRLYATCGLSGLALSVKGSVDVYAKDWLSANDLSLIAHSLMPATCDDNVCYHWT